MNQTLYLREVFYYYLGDIVYSIKKREEENVSVKIIEYEDSNETYSKEVLNLGNTSSLADFLWLTDSELAGGAPWSMEGIRGMQRFLQRVWRNFIDQDRNAKIGNEINDKLEKKLHQTILKVTEHIEGLKFNTAIAALIELNNELVALQSVPQVVAKPFLKLLSPLAPHIAEEIWHLANLGDGELSLAAWPIADVDKLLEDQVLMPIQVNGKIRGQIAVSVDLGQDEIKALALDVEGVKKYVPDTTNIKRFIFVPGKIINIVI